MAKGRLGGSRAQHVGSYTLPPPLINSQSIEIVRAVRSRDRRRGHEKVNKSTGKVWPKADHPLQCAEGERGLHPAAELDTYRTTFLSDQPREAPLPLC